MFRRACLFLLLGGLLAPAPALAAADCKAAQFADIPVTMIGRRPTMSAGINGRNDRFMLDSGAFHSTISAANAQQFGLTVRSLGPNARLTGVGGETSLGVATAKVFTIAGQDVHNVDFAVGGGDTGYAGVIGQNVLGLEDVEYDLPHGAVRLMKVQGCKDVDLAYWAGQRPYSVVKLQPTDHDKRSIGVVTVNGVTLKALFDTGAPDSTLMSGGARRLGLKPDDSEAAGFAHGVGRKEVRVWRARLETIDIGGEIINRPTLSILDQSQDAFDMVIGMDFFLSHRLFVDNQHHRMYLTYEGGPAFGLALKGGAVDGTGQAIDLTDKSAEPTDAAGYSQRGAVIASKGKPEAAVADFDKAIALAPTEARYLVQRAMARLALRQPQLAVADLDKALDLDPANIDARMTRAQLRVQNRSPKAAEDLDAADQALAPSSDTRLRLAGLNEQADRLEAALANYDLWIKAHPDDAKRIGAFNGRCWTRALMNRDLNLALADCDAALRLRPGSSEYLDSRALVRLRRGELDKALADYDAALAIQPRNAWSLYMRAVAERRAARPSRPTPTTPWPCRSIRAWASAPSGTAWRARRAPDPKSSRHPVAAKEKLAAFAAPAPFRYTAPMSHNTFGHLFRVTTWGESHGPALGCVVDGVPPGIAISAQAIQAFLDKRRPGQGKFVTQRQEPDAVRILSGVFEDDRTDGLRTTGTPISLMIENTDQRSKDYGEIAQAFRPGHADYPYFAKYGVRDYRGGGRSSARETAARVAAGAVARLVIPGVTVRAALVQIGPHRIDRANWDWDQVEQNPYWSPDAAIIPVWEEHLETVRKAGSSTGAVVEVEAVGVPAGWGAPLYGKLDAELASALMSINAAKGVEIGEGFASAALSGEDNADQMRMGNDGPVFLSNHAGGVLGGLSTGQPVVARVAFKPTSSILIPRESVNEAGAEIDLRTKGRHDPCVGIRGVPVVEAMTACVLADAFLRHRGQTGGGAFVPGLDGRRS